MNESKRFSNLTLRSFLRQCEFNLLHIAELCPISKGFVILYLCRSSVVGIAARYGLDVWESNPGGDEIFRTRPNRP